MANLTFRRLRADEIEARVAQVFYKDQQRTQVKGVSVLLYKDARCDMRILDETIGSFNWQREHIIRENIINGERAMVNYCKVSIWDEDKSCWVAKEDCGVESNTENAKGESSDAFKRACFSWGIGRELYTAPFIYIAPNDGENIKFTRFKVSEIAYDESGNISKVVVLDDKGNVRFQLGGGSRVSRRTNTSAQTTAQPDNLDMVAVAYLEHTPAALEYYKAMYHHTQLADFTQEELIAIHNHLKANNKI